MPNAIPYEADDPRAWRCLCGNRPTDEGFYPCHTDGTLTDPIEGWPGLYRCARCHRLIDGQTRMIHPPRSRPLEPRIVTAIEKAEDSFWNTIRTHFPEARSGDLDPLTAHRLTDIMHQALNAWIDANCYHLRYSLGQYVLYSGADPSPAQNALAIVVPEGVHCLDPDLLAEFDEATISPVCLWPNIDHIEAWTSPSDDQLMNAIAHGQPLSRHQRLVLLHRISHAHDAEAQALIDADQQRFGAF